jgi:hypothetical protein
MHSAIVVVKMPIETPSGRDRWLAFCAAISALQVNDAVVRLGENTWQLDFQQDPGALALLIGACDREKFSYGILPLDAAPQWKVSNSLTATTGDKIGAIANRAGRAAVPWQGRCRQCQGTDWPNSSTSLRR